MRDWILERSFASEVGRVRYDVMGQGPALVLLHGTPSSSYLWRNVAADLAQDFRVHLYDLPGYGQSEKRDGQDVSIAAQTRVLGQLLDHWGLSAPLIAAHDIGGTIALRSHLLEGRDFARISLLDAVTMRPRGGGRWGTPFQRHARDYDPQVFGGLPDYAQEGMLRAYFRTAMHRHMADTALQPFIDPWLGTDGRAAFYRQLSQLDERYTDEIEPLYATITQPVLILWGQEDQWLGWENGRRLHAAIPGSRLEMLPGAGHFVQEDVPGAVAMLLQDFFAPALETDPARPS